MIKNQDMGFSPGQQGMSTKVTMNGMREMVTGKCTGVIIVIIKGIGRMGCRMEMARYIS